MISRVADHCFWFGRYIDRAESTARLLQVTRTLVFDADIPVTQCWKPLVIVSGEHPALVKRHGEDAAGDGEIVQSYMTWDTDNLVSLQSSVRAARENARVIRDVLSLETWEEVNELYLWLCSDGATRLYAENREQFYRRVRRGTQLVLGLVRSTMLHDRPMSFLWLGVMLERVGQTARILDMNHHTMTLEGARQHQIVEVALLLSLLRACSGYEAFAKKSQGRATAKAVTSFLVFDQQFPRSLRYCVKAARRILTDIWPEALTGGIGGKSYGRISSLSEWLDGREASFTTTSLHATLTRIVDDTAAICSFAAEEMLGPPRPSPAKKTVTELAQTQSQSHTGSLDQGQTQHQG